MSESREINKLPLMLTAMASVMCTVLLLHLYVYLNFAKPEEGH